MAQSAARKLPLSRRFVDDLMRCARAVPLLTVQRRMCLADVAADEGAVDVYLMFDQRVLDPGPAARALEATEQELHGGILNELRGKPTDHVTQLPW